MDGKVKKIYWLMLSKNATPTLGGRNIAGYVIISLPIDGAIRVLRELKSSGS